MAATMSRRHLLAVSTLAISGLAVGGALSGRSPAVATAHAAFNAAAAQTASPIASPATNIGQAEAPKWSFTVTTFADPYTGSVTRPRTPPTGTRYVGAEVIIQNGSDQPLSFSLSDVMLIDKDGVAYPAGNVTGSDPKLVSQDLPGGERTRGWVWFAVPKDDRLAELRFVGPSPVFRIPVPADGR